MEPTSPPADGPVNPTAALDQVISRLQAKDDTRRFVGLSLLRTLLDKHESLRDDPAVISRCWNAIPTNFLKRLLKARTTEQRSQDIAKNMVTLAVSVIQAFTTLLDAPELEDERMIVLCGSLVAALSVTADDTRTLALQALHRVGGGAKGALVITQFEGFGTLMSTALKNDLAMDVVKVLLVTLIKEQKSEENTSKLKKIEESIFTTLLDSHKLEKALPILEAIANVLEESDYHRIPNWLPALTATFHNAFRAQPSNKLCRACTRLIRRFTSLSPSYDFFFTTKPPTSDGHSSTPSQSYPFSYLFTTFLLVDIRSTIPSLLEILGTPTYPPTALRLSASYDVLGAFIGTLVALWDSDEDSAADSAAYNAAYNAGKNHILDIPPTQLLALRKALAETTSLTLEYLRDRFDAAIAGTSGLHSSAIAGASDVQKTLTWESPTIALANDPVVLAGSRVLALWLREDENAQLRTEAAGCMDVFLHLYSGSGSTDAGVTGEREVRTEFRTHVLLALEGIVTVSAGVEALLEQDGWRILVGDLQACMSANAGAMDAGGYPYRVLSIIRVLLTVVESEEVAQTKESWLGFVSFLAALPAAVPAVSRTTLPREMGVLDPLEVWTAAGQLAVALVLKAPRAVQRKFKGDCDRICATAAKLLKKGTATLDEGTLEGLEEVIDGFGEMKV
ncbi:DUF1941-domain-containing protein [Mytilinidion resinicola]|uniref:DUF1941-domain-containing protein n=1 Tax=Mytilinidion resinicola TaxID=574789 RepID=A0A6A6Y7R0_9PEZI|nr:DUF1941-domain-containing protein [Mytilinidion resinicola]KAF2804014.1 DUF1941-domain-containing protein [Mytilinidion resinicola]